MAAAAVIYIKIFTDDWYTTMIDADVAMIRQTIQQVKIDIDTPDMKILKHNNRFEYMYQLFQKYPEFSEKHPTLLKKIANHDDLTHLETMLDNMEAIQQNKISRSQAETQMGNKLASQYFSQIKK